MFLGETEEKIRLVFRFVHGAQQFVAAGCRVVADAGVVTGGDAVSADLSCGGEELIGTLMILDRAPKGRNEKTTMDFVRRHDEYEKAPKLHDCCA